MKTYENLCKVCKDLHTLDGLPNFTEKKKNMIPTREQFKDLIASIKKAQEKEEKLDKAFELIWDDGQAQHVPFYISPLWTAVYKAFNMAFGLEENEYGDNELSWWLEMAPDKEAIYEENGVEHNVSDFDAFYDYLVELANQKHE